MPRLFVTSEAVDEFRTCYKNWKPSKAFQPKTYTQYLLYLLECEWRYEGLAASSKEV